MVKGHLYATHDGEPHVDGCECGQCSVWSDGRDCPECRAINPALPELTDHNGRRLYEKIRAVGASHALREIFAVSAAMRDEALPRIDVETVSETDKRSEQNADSEEG